MVQVSFFLKVIGTAVIVILFHLLLPLKAMMRSRSKFPCFRLHENISYVAHTTSYSFHFDYEKSFLKPNNNNLVVVIIIKSLAISVCIVYRTRYHNFLRLLLCAHELLTCSWYAPRRNGL